MANKADLVLLLQALRERDSNWVLTSAPDAEHPQVRYFFESGPSLTVVPSLYWTDEWNIRGWEGAGILVGTLAEEGLQVELTVFPPIESESNRPVVILRTDSNGERFFVDPEREAIYGDTPEEAITRAYVEWLQEVQRAS